VILRIQRGVVATLGKHIRKASPESEGCIWQRSTRLDSDHQGKIDPQHLAELKNGVLWHLDHVY